MDERVMVSVVRGYADSNAVWAVEHDGGQHGSSHMAVAGQPPPEWAAVRQKAKRRQAKDDAADANTDFVFEAPANLALALTGYRFDEMADNQPTLTPLVRKPSKGLAKVLSGLFKKG